ncbi:signal peptide peptidase SppA [Patescibacteria group bacterium]|nr:signal peptide peptidase SppA [Patescibacteria group bacterium]
MRFVILLVAITVIIFWWEEIDYAFNGNDELISTIENTITRTLDEEADGGYYDPNSCFDIFGNVAKIKIDDVIDSAEFQDEDGFTISVSSEDIIRQLEEVNQSPDYTAIMLVIDSPGGSFVPSEEITKTIERTEKPVIAVIKSMGTSGAYMVASSADYIFASRGSDVGSIGVTQSYADNYYKNQMEGITYNSLSSGKFKDTLDYNKSLTNEEKELLMKDIMKMHNIFVEMVAENRNMPIEEASKLADGSTMLGDDALAKGLIDAIGGEFEAIEWITEQIGEEVSVCNYN